MTGKLDEFLLEKIKNLDKSASGEAVDVIVTTRGKPALASLEERGLAVAHAYENITAVSGRIRLVDLAGLETLDQVEKVEFDGEMHAL